MGDLSAVCADLCVCSRLCDCVCTGVHVCVCENARASVGACMSFVLSSACVLCLCIYIQVWMPKGMRAGVCVSTAEGAYVALACYS